MPTDLKPLIGRDGLPIMPECRVCGLRKKPFGRDSMDNGLCDSDCEGYMQEPWQSSYWQVDEPPLPGDSDAD